MTESNEIAGYIVILAPEQLAQKTPKVPFFIGENSIGRTSNKKICINDMSVSSEHAMLNVTLTSMTIVDRSKNGIKINSQENRIAKYTEVTIDGGMIIYIGEVKCKFQRITPQQILEETIPTKIQLKNDKKKDNILSLVSDSDEQKQVKLLHKQSLREVEIIKDVADQFSISDGFQEIKIKQVIKEKGKKQAKESKKNSKIIKEEKQEINKSKDEQKEIKQVKKEKRNQGKKDSLERKNAKELQQKELALKNQKSEEKEKEKIERAKAKAMKDPKPILKEKSQKLLIQESKKNNPSKEKQQKKKEAKLSAQKQQKQKQQQSKEKMKDQQRQTSKQKQKEKKKQVSKQKQKEKSKEKEKQKKRNSLQKQTDIQGNNQDQTSDYNLRNKKKLINEPKKLNQATQGQLTKRRTENRKRLPSELIISNEDCMPARRSFHNKRILISGFILTLTKKYFYLVDNTQVEFDYLVMKEYKRTFKALYSICNGISIIRYDWIKQSQYFERILKPQNYLFKDSDHIYNAIEKVRNGHRVFKDLQFFLGSDDYHLKSEDIQMLIYTCGGEVLRKAGKLTSKEKEGNNKIAIIRNREQSNSKIYEEDVKKAKKIGFQLVYTIQMILDSCEKQAIDWKKNETKSKLT